jgi:hypothetical protein
MAQHLLVAADRFELERLRRICERRLCETVDVETVATTLTLAEQNNAEVRQHSGLRCLRVLAVRSAGAVQACVRKSSLRHSAHRWSRLGCVRPITLSTSSDAAWGA